MILAKENPSFNQSVHAFLIRTVNMMDMTRKQKLSPSTVGYK